MKTAATFLAAALCASAALADTQKFGAALTGLPATKLESVLAKPEDGQKVRLEGTVKAVCVNKGCWLELAQGDRSIHVTFKDYAFFVPKNGAGRTVVAEGIVKVERPSPSDLAHLEKEGATKAGAGARWAEKSVSSSSRTSGSRSGTTPPALPTAISCHRTPPRAGYSCDSA